MARSIAYPFSFDGRGRTAAASGDDHIRDLIEQVLFTSPGERVNRPTFGGGVLQLPFAPNGDQLAQTTEFLIRGNLSQWLGTLIDIDSIVVDQSDSTLSITVRYVVRRTQSLQIATFEKSV
jgi:phage baseplate assembly protein W